jgi:hypothetical protein
VKQAKGTTKPPMEQNAVDNSVEMTMTQPV